MPKLKITPKKKKTLKFIKKEKPSLKLKRKVKKTLKRKKAPVRGKKTMRFGSMIA